MSDFKDFVMLDDFCVPASLVVGFDSVVAYSKIVGFAASVVLVSVDPVTDCHSLMRPVHLSSSSFSHVYHLYPATAPPY